MARPARPPAPIFDGADRLKSSPAPRQRLDG
jgi:hypothetical protein